MKINRLRLLGFKSFVEPTELVIERGLTGVVGPNGCGKSNLLEALRWVMGETSHKSMRAAAMDDVIFSGTNQRPARNTAEVTIFLDNCRAPGARRVQRQRHARDHAPHRARGGLGLPHQRPRGARPRRARSCSRMPPPAPARRRWCARARSASWSTPSPSSAAASSRTPPASPACTAAATRPSCGSGRAEGNLARLNDILGQLNSQIESLKRQARAARRYKEISAEIRKLEALSCCICAGRRRRRQVDAEEADLADDAGEGRRAPPRPEAKASPRRRRRRAACSRCATRKRPSAPPSSPASSIEQENFEREATARRRPRRRSWRRAPSSCGATWRARRR